MPHTRAEVVGIHWYRYSLVTTLSSPGPRAQHSTALRVVTFVGSGIYEIRLDGTKSPCRGGLPRPPVVAVCDSVRRLRKHWESRICQARADTAVRPYAEDL